MALIRCIVALAALLCWGSVAVAAGAPAAATTERLVIVDQDNAGATASNTRAIMAFLQAPNVKVLGITIVTGDWWRDEEVVGTLHMLEALGRTDVGVYPGAVNPLWHSKAWQRQAEKLYGVKASWQGAWTDGWHAPDVVPLSPLGLPKTKPMDEDAAHFMVRMVRAHPGKVTIFAGGPLTNVAMALALEPRLAELAQELVFMGGSVAPATTLPEWMNNPTHEFNFWFDPEAASAVLRAPWKRITQTTIDASLATRAYPDLLEPIFKSNALAATYLRKNTELPLPPVLQIAWDDLAAAVWLDPAIIREERVLYEDVVTDHGPAYGNTVLWSEKSKPAEPRPLVHLVMKADIPRFNALMLRLFTAPTPHSSHSQTGK